MREAIEDRELFVLDDLDVVVRGTYHKPAIDRSNTQSNLSGQNRVGLVFLNGLPATRASNGDSTVYWASSYAERGYPAFRLDLPGFGDSAGDPPPDWLSFINRGGYASIASAKINELMARFDLSGVILVGHCSGAVTALYTAAINRECRGLILLDPYFHVQPTAMPPKIRQQLSLWAWQNPLGGTLSNAYGLIKKARLLLRGNAPPENANSSLLHCWQELASTGLPTLILKAPSRRVPGTKARFGEFDYVQFILRRAGCRSEIAIRIAEGANHSFANRTGRDSVRRHTEKWLETYFPLPKYKTSDLSLARPECGSINMTIETANRV